GEVTTIAGTGSAGSLDGTGTAASFNGPTSVAIDINGNVIVADQGNHKIRVIDTGGEVTTLAGSGTPGSSDGNGANSSFNLPTGLAIDGSNNSIYVTDLFNQKIRKIDSEGNVSTVAGSGSSGSLDGNGTEASFNFPVGIVLDAEGSIYVADAFNHLIRKINSDNNVTTLAGTGIAGFVDGNGSSASFNTPTGLVLDPLGNLFVIDQNNHSIRKIISNGDVSTIVGSGSAGDADGDGITAEFNQP
ncbi:MAG: hypothetical protein ACO2ZZ_14360, partial [Cyclobacteriaceae bacterium]